MHIKTINQTDWKQNLRQVSGLKWGELTLGVLAKFTALSIYLGHICIIRYQFFRMWVCHFGDFFQFAGFSRSPGFGLTLVAETTEGVFFGAEKCANPKGSSDGPSVPEDVGIDTAALLMEEIYRGGCVDSTNQSLGCLSMALGDKDVSKVVLGELSPYT